MILRLETNPLATEIWVDETVLTALLQDGRQIRVPLSWYPRLQAGTPAERDAWELLGDGYALFWPALDEHIGVEGLLAGRRSAEKPDSFGRWAASRQGRQPSTAG